MSIATKQQFKIEITKRFESILTAKQLNEALIVLTEELSRYDMTALEGSENDNCNLNLLNEFISAKITENKSKGTIERYRYMLTRILTTINVPITKINVYHLRQYLMNEKDRGMQDSTINGYRTMLCCFFNWLQNESLISANPTANLCPIKCQKVIRTPYSDVEIEKLKTACDNVRDKAILMFMLATGCRISEVVGTNRDDINWGNMSCKVLGKGNKERIVYLDTVAVMYLRQYLNQRKDDKECLFCSRTLSRLTVAGVRYILNELEKKTGVKNVHPHRFRRTLATRLIDRGMPIQDVAHILGHEKVDTTMKYIYIEDNNVKVAYGKYH